MVFLPQKLYFRLVTTIPVGSIAHCGIPAPARAGLSLVFLATTIGLRRSERLRPFWPLSLASSPMMGVTLGKLFDVVAVVLSMLLLPRLAGEDFGAL